MYSPPSPEDQLKATLESYSVEELKQHLEALEAEKTLTLRLIERKSSHFEAVNALFGNDEK